MDERDLLRDLHFQLSSNAGSGLASEAEDLYMEDKVQLEVQDRKELTEKWVANVSLRDRRRTVSYDSYFGSYSVCDNLKKSFLKPCRVTDSDLEELRLRLAGVKLEDSDVNNFLNKDQDCISSNCDNEWYSNNPSADARSSTGRSRSQTVPWCDFSQATSSDKLTETHMSCNDLNNGIYLNMTAVQPVDLIKDILFDENHNVISKSHNNHSGSQDIAIESVEIKETELQGFRDVSLFPSQQELKEATSARILPNKAVGSYSNNEEYLKTHFYLLREDFIRPLKEGIADYKKQFFMGTIPAEVKNLKLHFGVHVIEPQVKENKLGIALEMGFPLSEKIGDKDFMEGSLVLLTPNHFEDIFVGSVISCSFIPRMFQHGKKFSQKTSKKNCNVLMVQLHGTSHFDPRLKNCNTLAESQAFFQPYYNVMKIFQGMRDGDLPMKECIIGLKKQVAVRLPSYLDKSTEYTLEDAFKVKVAKDATWPSAELLQVNDSQLRALKKALSQKLVVIQGPPGTGKTYLGCKVAKALLQNRSIWNKKGNQPMLLMCQTNHALDQFMELLLPITKNMIRIGNQSKSDILAPFTIRERLKKSCSKNFRHCHTTEKRNELRHLDSKIKACHFELNRVSTHGIVDLKSLVYWKVVEPHLSKCFVSSENFLEWLEGAQESQVLDCGEKKDVSAAKPHSSGCQKHALISPSSHMVSESHGQLIRANWKHDHDDGCRSNTSLNINVEYVLSLPELELALETQQNKEFVEEDTTAEKILTLNSIKNMKNRLQIFQRHIYVKSEHCIQSSTVSCLWIIAPCTRWVIYRSWIQKLKIKLRSHLENLESLYMEASSTFADLKQYEKLQAMSEAELVGMTTSAAARLYPVLQELRCPIVLVEEAAEVHESHIVATITKHCQHLILLGDHMQLKPRSACYALSMTHFTDISLFERLLLNKTVNVNTLLTQHRMQPEISALIRPSIYPILYNHKCTKNRENIIGMRKNVFFFSHQWEESKNVQTGSYSNIKEAKMAVQIARYLRKQNYNGNEICILTAYREQVAVMEENSKLYPELNGVRMLTIDNFQGEECRIVVLSLVRNNSENQIGFLKIQNRVCVALSRARDGLFILGNIELLSQNSELWLLVHRTLQSQGAVGWSLPLNCTYHRKKRKLVFSPEDLEQYVCGGGCQQVCSYKLACGHTCRRTCHPDDRFHLNHRCEEPCLRTCAFGHNCFKKCSEKCENCETLMWKYLDCGHTVLIKCCLDLSNYLCGVTIKKCMAPCLHRVNLQCWMPPVSYKYCPNQCPALLQCGHQCPFRCNSLKHPNHDKIRCNIC